jgi:multiple antibiotic resistance protein
METLLDYFILSFTSLFVIVDPIGQIPAFLTMTKKNSLHEQTHMAMIASIVCALILLLFVFSGTWIFKIFGITLSAFQIAGGIILLLIGLDMLKARQSLIKQSREENEEGIEKEDIAVTPLAVPMLSGPGAITAVVLLASRAPSLSYQLILCVNIVLVSFITFIALWIAALRSSQISAIAMRIFTRIMGLLLTVISVQFILNGLQQAGFLLPVR